MIPLLSSKRWVALLLAALAAFPLTLPARTLIEAGSDSDPKAAPPKRAVTARFRREFDASLLQPGERLVIAFCAGDGEIIYLNGRELARVNMPKGPIGAKTLALAALDEDQKKLFIRVRVPPEAIHPGKKNLIEAEVHSATAGGSPLSFDLALKTLPPDEPLPPPNPEAKQVLELYHAKHYVPFGTLIPDGYFDGGRNMALDAEDHAVSGREILLVDRSHDPELAKDLEFARSLRELPPLLRVRQLSAYLHQILTPPAGIRALEPTMEQLEEEFANKPIHIGDLQDQFNAGVCRHRALLFKILADEAGLKAAMVRGDYVHIHSGGGGPHAWNEVQLDDGRRFLVDTMGSSSSDIPEITTAALTNPDLAKRYLKLDGTHYYETTRAQDFLPAAPKLEPAPWADGERLRLKLCSSHGTDMGVVEYRANLTKSGEVWHLGERFGASGGANSVSTVDAEASNLTPISGRWKDARLGEVQSIYHPGTAELSHAGVAAPTTVPADANVLDSKELIFELRRLPLKEGYKTILPVFFSLGDSGVTSVPTGLEVGVQVGGKETVEAPAGKFECYRVDLSLGWSFWISTDAHRYPVRFVEESVVGNLESVSPQGADEPVNFHDDELGVSLTAPPGWMVCRYKAGQPAGHSVIRTFDPEANTEHGHILYFPTAALSAEERKSSKTWAQNYVKQSFAKTNDNVKVRVESWKDYTVGDRPGTSFVADYTVGGKAHSIFMLYVVGPKVSEQFMYACPSEAFDALMAQVDSIIASYRRK